MSRSRKKTPIFGITTARSDKPFKKAEHQRERSAVKKALAQRKELLPHPKKFGNPWASPKDGRKWFDGKGPIKFFWPRTLEAMEKARAAKKELAKKLMRK